MEGKAMILKIATASLATQLKRNQQKSLQRKPNKVNEKKIRPKPPN